MLTAACPSLARCESTPSAGPHTCLGQTFGCVRVVCHSALDVADMLEGMVRSMACESSQHVAETHSRHVQAVPITILKLNILMQSQA